uniref:Uncharacterized protein n=1 Tax=Cacopsylla melanoneura TaxID=428564 RepID=A0A8D8YMZ7_9HEMI
MIFRVFFPATYVKKIRKIIFLKTCSYFFFLVLLLSLLSLMKTNYFISSSKLLQKKSKIGCCWFFLVGMVKAPFFPIFQSLPKLLCRTQNQHKLPRFFCCCIFLYLGR